jgi:hypothetical protein
MGSVYTPARPRNSERARFWPFSDILLSDYNVSTKRALGERARVFALPLAQEWVVGAPDAS